MFVFNIQSFLLLLLALRKASNTQGANISMFDLVNLLSSLNSSKSHLPSKYFHFPHCLDTGGITIIMSASSWNVSIISLTARLTFTLLVDLQFKYGELGRKECPLSTEFQDPGVDILVHFQSLPRSKILMIRKNRDSLIGTQKFFLRA